ncbi:type I-E CRISPR-associated protein Cas7/Cse4/CasC, partial [bacterium]|nr:type I-E CRISPR-associated protein Cas7/Cse4/CasC [bacterium]
KTAFFGGYPRARISSQCLKRSIRTSDVFGKAMDGHIGTRTVFFPTQVQDALANSTIDKKHHKKIVDACTQIAKSEDKGGAKSKKDDAGADFGPKTGQLIHLGPDEAELFVSALGKLLDDDPKLFEQFLKEPCPKKPTTYTKRLSQAYQKTAVDIALFGRMTTSPAFENVEAAMQVAHAISTHEAILEVDYFTAVDDDPHGRLGAGLVQEAQFTSATFYKYFSLQWEQLVTNLGGDASLARQAVAAFLDAAAKAIPSGKRNSHGNSNLPDAIVVEIKNENVPTNYANAFVAPARTHADRDGEHDIVSESIRMLAQYICEIENGYGLTSGRLVYTTRERDAKVDFGTGEHVQRKDNLAGLIAAALGALNGKKE